MPQHLKDLCTCGHTRGKHVVATPHRCIESGCECTSFDLGVVAVPAFIDIEEAQRWLDANAR